MEIVKLLHDRLEAISKILLILGSLAGGIWVFFQYLDKKHDARVSESTGYVQRFSKDPLLAAHRRIEMAWYAVHDTIQTPKETPGASDEEYKRRKKQLSRLPELDQRIPAVIPSSH